MQAALCKQRQSTGRSAAGAVQPTAAPPAFAGVSLAAILDRLPGIGTRRSSKASSGLLPSRQLMSGLRPLRIAPDDGLAALLGLRRAASLQSRIEALEPRQGHAGRWHKVDEACDSMKDAIEMVNLAWYLRPALPLLKNLNIIDDGQHFSTVLKAPGGGILDVVERYPWSGEPVPHKRRDRRRGQHLGYVSRAEDGVSPRITCTWQDPYGGECCDTFVLSEDGQRLTQITDMSVHGSGRRTVYRTVYSRVTAHP